MASNSRTVNSLVIPNGSSVSNSLSRSELNDLRGADALCIQAPSSATNSTFTLEVSADESTWVDLQSGGTDVTLGLGKALTLDTLPFMALRLSGASAEGAERTFLVSIQENER